MALSILKSEFTVITEYGGLSDCYLNLDGLVDGHTYQVIMTPQAYINLQYVFTGNPIVWQNIGTANILRGLSPGVYQLKIMDTTENTQEFVINGLLIQIYLPTNLIYQGKVINPS